MKQKPQPKVGATPQVRPFNRSKFYQPVKLNVIVDTKEDKTKGVYKFGKGNKEPIIMLDLIQESPTAKSCVSRLASFIAADGFLEPKAAEFPVNPYQSADSLLAQLASTRGVFKAHALKVDYGAKDEVVAVWWLSVAKVRKLSNGNYTYNPNEGQSDYKVDETKEYKPFIPGEPFVAPKDLPKDTKIVTHSRILYVFDEDEFNPIYSIPDWYSAKGLLIADAELCKMEGQMVKNNFEPGGIIYTRIYSDVKNEDKKSELDYFDETIKAFTGEGESRFGLCHMMGESKEQAPQLISFDNSKLNEKMTGSTERVTAGVCRAFQVPPVLVGIQTAGKLGDVQELKNHLKLFNVTILKDQQKISASMKAIYPQFDWNISTLNIVDYLPEQVWDSLTQDEKRAIAGYEPITPTDAN